MMRKTRLLLLSAVAAVALIAGCGSTPPGSQKPATVETRSPLSGTPAAKDTPGASSGVAAQSSVATVDLASQGAAGTAGAAATSTAALAAAKRVIYFDFDSFEIRDEYKPTIDLFAKALVADKTRRLTVEGHTDERGGHEYNLALGQKRAEAVVHALTLLGAADAQMEAVSFGEERPADPGHDEAAWAKNRRVELKDR